MSDVDDLRALVLAGRRRDDVDTVARAAGVSLKAFAPVAGEPMIERVVRVLLEHPRITGIDVSLPEDADCRQEATRLQEWSHEGLVRLVAAGSSPADAVAGALDRHVDGRRQLVTTADHALLTGPIVDQFLDRCRHPGIDAFVGLLPLEIVQHRYPDVKRTGLSFRDGRYSGCNLFMLNPGPGTRSLMSFWQRMEASRKTPWKMALNIGPGALIAYLLRRTTLAQAVEVIGARAGARVTPVILDMPEAAIDVDTPADLAFADSLLRAKV